MKRAPDLVVSETLHRRAPLLSTRAVASTPRPDQPPAYERLELHNLFTIAEWQDQIPWQPFMDGIDIHRLHGDGVTGRSTALIRFRKAGRVPLHEHVGCEHIIVLAGSERDQNSSVKAGTLIINPPGTRHSVVSDAGCIALAIYESPVQFVPETRK